MIPLTLEEKIAIAKARLQWFKDHQSPDIVIGLQVALVQNLRDRYNAGLDRLIAAIRA